MPNKVTGDALIKLIVIQVRLVSLLFSGVANWAKIREKEKKDSQDRCNLEALFSVQNLGVKT